MHYIPSFKKFQIAVPDLLVVVVCIVSFVFSVIESKLNTDAHHWGLMYGNAIDLVRGSIPFKEIFIQYGILTTIIQGFSFPFYARGLNDIILPDEQQKIDNLIAREDAIYIAHLRKIEDFRSIPSNYCIVYRAQKPREVRFMPKDIFLVVPRKIAEECLTINIKS
jgi:hypothetical protein